MFRDGHDLVPCKGAETGRENKVTQASLKRPTAVPPGEPLLLAAGLSVSTAATVAIAVPIATSSAQSPHRQPASKSGWRPTAHR